MNLRRIDYDAGFLVADEGVVLVAVPQLLHQIDEFACALIAGRVFGMGGEAEIGRCVAAGGDDVPARPAAGQPVEGCKFSRQQIRIFIRGGGRSEEHTSELQSLMRISYAVFCLKKKKTK